MNESNEFKMVRDVISWDNMNKNGKFKMAPIEGKDKRLGRIKKLSCVHKWKPAPGGGEICGVCKATCLRDKTGMIVEYDATSVLTYG